jgi:hypothetical protein
MLAWAAALAVIVIFLLGLSPLGDLKNLGTLGFTSILYGFGLVCVGVVAVVVAIYWGRE